MAVRTLRRTLLFVAATLVACHPLRPDVGRFQPPAPHPARSFRCAEADAGARTRPRLDLHALMPVGARRDGEVISFDAEPPILSPGHTGGVRLRALDVVGTVPEITIRLADADGTLSHWFGPEQVKIAGVPISRFDVSWDAATVRCVLAQAETGFDVPAIVWGYVRAGHWDAVDTEDRDTRTIPLRFAPTDLLSAAVPVRSIGDADGAFQYTSDVVNLRWDGFGARWPLVDDGTGDDLQEVSRRFYRHFQDTYQVLAVTEADVHVGGGGGYHENVYTKVCGVGLEEIEGFTCRSGKGELDRRPQYADGFQLHVLEGVEYYPREYGLMDDGVAHEYAHQYAHYFDWKRLANVARGGWVPKSHTPLVTTHETLVGAALQGDREVVSTTDTAGHTEYRLAIGPRPARYHPLTLYAMGLMPATAVPPVEVFTDQSQFTSEKSYPPGTPVKGTTVTVPIDRITNHPAYGPRTGPVLPAVVRRATIIVSRGRLLTQAELSYWTVFAHRLTEGGDRVDYRGFGSFAAATEGRSRFDTTIRPRVGTPMPRTVSSTDPPFARDAWPGIMLDAEVPTEITLDVAGTARLDLAGQITDATLRGRDLGVALYRACTTSSGCKICGDTDTTPTATIAWEALTPHPTGRFEGTVQFEATSARLGRGEYRLWFYARAPDRWIGPGWSTLRVR